MTYEDNSRIIIEGKTKPKTCYSFANMGKSYRDKVAEKSIVWKFHLTSYIYCQDIMKKFLRSLKFLEEVGQI